MISKIFIKCDSQDTIVRVFKADNHIQINRFFASVLDCIETYLTENPNVKVSYSIVDQNLFLKCRWSVTQALVNTIVGQCLKYRFDVTY